MPPKFIVHKSHDKMTGLCRVYNSIEMSQYVCAHGILKYIGCSYVSTHNDFYTTC